MKKNLLYLWALICSVSLLTACSSDDDNTVNDETTPPEEERQSISMPTNTIDSFS